MDREFSRLGCAQGTLPERESLVLREALDQAPVVQLEHDDCARGYVGNPRVRDTQAQLNTGQVFLQLGVRQRAALVPVLELLRSDMRISLGAPWRIVNIRCWKTLPTALKVEANDWHVDGFPSVFLKLMVYLSPVSRNFGTTELILADGSNRVVEGPIGTWLLFRNGVLRHRGVAPAVSGFSRVVAEVTIVRAFQDRLTPISAGFNAKYPRYPWSGIPDGAD